MTPAPSLSARGLGKTWKDRNRRIDIDIDALDLFPGEVKAMTGPSGSGKSTALDMLGLALRPERAGRLMLNLQLGAGPQNILPDVKAGRESRLARLRGAGYGYVVQTNELMPFLTLGEDFALQQRLSGRPDPELAQAFADYLEIGDLLNQFPSHLSVGQCQRAAVVRAASALPAVLLADEPTSSVDPELKDKVITVLKHAAEAGSAVLVVTHDHELIDRHGIAHVGVQSERVEGGWRTRFHDEGARQ